MSGGRRPRRDLPRGQAPGARPQSGQAVRP
jgi:hypothetical protein